MSKTKFNGFEKYFIQTALRHAIDEAEKDVLAAEADGKRSIYAPGYFTMVGNEIIDKVNSMTLKKIPRLITKKIRLLTDNINVKTKTIWQHY